MDRQYVGIDFHRRRSVIVRKNADGEKLASVRVANDVVSTVHVLSTNHAFVPKGRQCRVCVLLVASCAYGRRSRGRCRRPVD